MRPDPSARPQRPRLLALELWGVGDLALATPFLNEAVRAYDVYLLAKPAAAVLQPMLWPDVRVLEWTAPWTAFRGKYALTRWPWAELVRVLRSVRSLAVDCGVSARPDPRDHAWLKLAGARRTLGFPRAGSRWFLSQAVPLPVPPAHRYECWRRLADRLGFPLPSWRDRPRAARPGRRRVLLHSGAARAIRVWPLERCRRLVDRLRSRGWEVQVACDPEQSGWWQQHGEGSALAPAGLAELMRELETTAAFVGNDSGPGHLAAVLGVPTYTIFGPQLPELFHPIHPDSDWIAGRPCPWKPCFDHCRFPAPHCLLELAEAEVSDRIERFLERHVPQGAAPRVAPAIPFA